MAIVSSQRSIGITPTFVTAIPGGPATLVIVNTDSAKSVVIDNDDKIGLTTGVILPPNTVITVPYYPGNPAHSLYGIVSAGTAVVSFVVTSPGA